MSRFHLFSLLGLLGALSLGACGDRLTAPEAEALVTAIEQPLGSGRERLWDRMGWGVDLSRLKQASRVVILQDGRPVTYSAVVFERLMVPANGSGRSACLGPRWFLFLWRSGERPEGLTLAGGRFDLPLSPPRGCDDISFMGPTPSALRYPPSAAGEQSTWASDGGRGLITPGIDAGGCGFLAPKDAEFLRRDVGITCRMTRHRVSLQSTLHPITGRTTGDGVLLGPESMRIELAPTVVIGVQYSIDCAVPRWFDACHHRSP